MTAKRVAPCLGQGVVLVLAGNARVAGKQNCSVRDTPLRSGCLDGRPALLAEEPDLEDRQAIALRMSPVLPLEVQRPDRRVRTPNLLAAP